MQSIKLFRVFFTIVTFLFSIILFGSCKPDCRDLDIEIKKTVKDGKINEAECNNLTRFIETNKENMKKCTSDLFSENRIDKSKMTEFLSQRQGPSKENIQCGVKPLEPTSSLSKLIFFLDPSTSMNGYVKGSTEFKRVFSKLLTNSWNSFPQDSIAIKYVGKSTKEVKVSSPENLKDITSQPFDSAGTSFVASQTTSEFYKILQLILKDLKADNVVTFFSDNIYIPDKNTGIDSLDAESAVIKTLFSGKFQELHFVTTIFQCNSNFNGYYYSYNGKQTELKEAKRPFYVWIMGTKENINLFMDANRNIFDKEQVTCQNDVTFVTSDSSYSNYNLLYYNKQGEYSIDREDKKTVVLKGIETRGKKKGILFSVATNLPQLSMNPSVNNSYLTDVQNYKVSNGYSIEKIEKSSEASIDANEKEKIKSMDYILTIRAEKLPSEALSTLLIELPFQLPIWVAESNTKDDTDIKNTLEKTFGLNVLLEGIYDAYRLKNKDSGNYKLKISIKKGN